MTEYLVIEGSADPDGVGHYPHAQAPGQVLALASPFLARTLARA
jgi:hypothetical protein